MVMVQTRKQIQDMADLKAAENCVAAQDALVLALATGQPWAQAAVVIDEGLQCQAQAVGHVPRVEWTCKLMHYDQTQLLCKHFLSLGFRTEWGWSDAYSCRVLIVSC